MIPIGLFKSCVAVEINSFLTLKIDSLKKLGLSFLTILLRQIVGSVNVDRHLHYLVPVHGLAPLPGLITVGVLGCESDPLIL